MTPAARLGHPLAHLARALGIPDGAGCRCALCGPSPFDAAGARDALLGVGWSDWPLMRDRNADTLCAGCYRLIRGKPGGDPFPLRLRSLAVRAGTYAQLDRATLFTYCLAPPADLELLSWATSQQRHHHLHAGWCTPDRLRIGADDGPIVLAPAAWAPVGAALTQLRGDTARGTSATPKPLVSRDELARGDYTPQTVRRGVATLGVAAWNAAVATLAARRGHPAFRLLLEHCPSRPDVLPDGSPLTPPPMLTPVDEDAITLLGALALGSRLRLADPIPFWSTRFLRRVVRHAHRPLPQFIARAMRDLDVETSGPAAERLATVAREWSDARDAAVMAALADRAPLLVALAQDAHKTAQASRSRRTAAPALALTLDSTPNELPL